MEILLKLLSMIFGELIKQLPSFLREMFSTVKTAEVKDGPLPEADADFLDNDSIDRMLGEPN